MNKKASFFLYLVLVSTFSIAQEKEVQITPIPFQNTNDIAAILRMAQDYKGHLWLSAYGEGLIKYDGKNMLYYRPEVDNANSLASPIVEDILIDKNGFIWLGNSFVGLDKLDPETGKFIHYAHDPNNPNSIRSNRIVAILEDEEGIFWIGTRTGLDRFDPITEIFTHVFSDDPDAEIVGKEDIRTLYLDKEGIIWIGTGSPWYGEETQGGLFSYDRKTDEIIHYLHSKEDNSLIDNRVSALFEDSRGVFWVGTAGDGLHTMDRKKGTFTRHEYDPDNPQKLSRPALNDHGAADDNIRFINEDELGNIWIGTLASGINSYNPTTKIIRHYGLAEFGINSFTTSLKTQDGLLWFSSWPPNNPDNVLFKINSSPRKIDLVDLGSVAYSFVENEDGSFYIGTKDGLVYLDVNKEVQKILLYAQNGIRNNSVINLRKDEKGNLWVHTLNGLHIYDPQTKKVIKSFRHDSNNRQSISSDTVVTSIQINENKVLLGTRYGFDILDLESETFKRYFHDPEDLNSINGRRVFDILKDKEQNIWLLSGGGLNLFNLEKRTLKRHENIVLGNVAFEDSKGRLWIGSTFGGLRMYDKEKDTFTLFLDNSGLLNSHLSVYGMTEDHDGLLWLNTSLGYIRLNPENGDSFLFGQSWGVIARLNTSNGGYTASNGDVLFGYGTGFFQFKPQEYKEEQNYSPSPFIDKFFIDSQALVVGESAILQHPLSETTQITLDHTQSNFAFDYGYINYKTDANEHQVVYKLENYEEAWRSNSGDNTAAYYQVPPGNYVFRIRASNINGTWEEKSIDIIILPPWYQTWWAYTLCILVAAGLIRGFVVYRSRKLKAENKILEDRVSHRTKELHKSLENLKSTQSQLIQSEKMASLGELTAGIAHEIQNPLNFVNNFSEVSKELFLEMNEELDKGDINEAKEIGKDIEKNLDKINHHGNRASSIVKGMLEHSRTSSGEKQLTDINALADEYLRLAYHGLRAKDKNFNADFKTDFDKDVPKIQVVSQDISRVLLNLINNGFQSIDEQSKKGIKGFKPELRVTTKKRNDTIEICIKDNGPGIPDDIKDKIFQPFFTTKPTGKGTGLGLSLAYDIVKAHGGALRMKSESNKGALFTIALPIGNIS